MNKKTYVSSLFMTLGIIFTTALILSNILAAKQLAIGPWNVPAGTLCFPLSYILSDVVSEVYGYNASRKLVWIGFMMQLLMMLLVTIAIIWPAPIWFTADEAFKTVLGSTPRIAIAGYIAYHAGSWFNDAIMSKMKIASRDRHNGDTNKGFGSRAILSTLIGEFADSVIFIPIAFYGSIPAEQFPTMIILQVALKTLYEIIALPMTTIIVKKVKDYEGEVIFDDGLKLGLFRGK